MATKAELEKELEKAQVTPITKKWYESKTVWLNVITTAIGVLTLVSESLPEECVPYILTLIGALNVALRVWFTDTAVTK